MTGVRPEACRLQLTARGGFVTKEIGGLGGFFSPRCTDGARHHQWLRGSCSSHGRFNQSAITSPIGVSSDQVKSV